MQTRMFGIVLAGFLASSCGAGAPLPATDSVVDGPPGADPMAALATRGESRFALAEVLPRDTQVLVEVSDVGRAFGMVASFPSLQSDPEIARTITPAGWAASFGAAFQMTEGDALALVHALSSAGMAMRHLPDRPQLAVVLRFRDASAVRPLLASPRFESLGAGHFSLARGGAARPADSALTQLLGEMKASGREEESILWLEGPATLAIGMDAYLTDLQRTSEGRQASLVEAAPFASVQDQVPPNALLRAYWDAAMLSHPGIVGENIANGWFRSPTPWTAAVELDELGSHFTLTGGLSGANVPGPDVVPPPIEGKLAKLLPEETWVSASVSTRSPGGTDAIISWLRQMGKLDPEARAAADILFGSGPEASQALSALGDEAVFGVVTPRGAVPSLFDGDLLDNSAVVWVQELRAPDTARQLVHEFLDRAAPRQGMTRTPDGFEGKPQPGIEIFAEVKGDKLFVGGGAPSAIARVRDGFRAKGPKLTDNERFKRAANALPAASQLRAWVDMQRLLEALEVGEGRTGERVVPPGLIAAAGSSLSSALSLTLATEPARLDHRLETINFLGYAAGIGVYGARRYIASAKTSEAKNTIGAISRGAMAAFERETFGGHQAQHKLCKAAPDVPNMVPRGERYMPKNQDGSDYETGDDKGGWRCLKFAMSMPHYYQYAYRVGGNYKGPKRGGPDPGPHGFEASAEGDLDGDGKTSLFTRTGSVNPKTKMLMMATQIFIDEEFE